MSLQPQTKAVLKVLALELCSNFSLKPKEVREELCGEGPNRTGEGPHCTGLSRVEQAGSLSWS